jgi:hypothetical protein
MKLSFYPEQSTTLYIYAVLSATLSRRKIERERERVALKQNKAPQQTYVNGVINPWRQVPIALPAVHVHIFHPVQDATKAEHFICVNG